MSTKKNILILILSLTLTSCTVNNTPKDSSSATDIMPEEDRQRLMIQKDPDEENRKIMEENLKRESLRNSPPCKGEMSDCKEDRGGLAEAEGSEDSDDPMLYMDQARYDEESGEIVEDRMQIEKE